LSNLNVDALLAQHGIDTDSLTHHGIKGMRWGVRRDRNRPGGADGKPNNGGDSSSSKSGSGKSSSSGSPRLSRKEFKAKIKVEKEEFYKQKADRVIGAALKDPHTLISLSNGVGYPTVVTGREFKTYLERGGVFDIKYTDVFATKQNGTFVRNANLNEQYKKPKR
jgi:hypothetical protein